MKQQAEGSWIFRPAFLDAEKDVSGHHDGRVGYEGIEVPALAAFLQFQMLLGRTEEYFDVPTLAVNADNVFIGNGEVCQTASKSDPPSASNFDPLRACL